MNAISHYLNLLSQFSINEQHQDKVIQRIVSLLASYLPLPQPLSLYQGLINPWSVLRNWYIYIYIYRPYTLTLVQVVQAPSNASYKLCPNHIFRNAPIKHLRYPQSFAPNLFSSS